MLPGEDWLYFWATASVLPARQDQLDVAHPKRLG